MTQELKINLIAILENAKDNVNDIIELLHLREICLIHPKMKRYQKKLEFYNQQIKNIDEMIQIISHKVK